MDDLVKCSADRAYKVNAPTIEERAQIWTDCATVKAKTNIVVFLIITCIGLIIIYHNSGKINHVFIAALVAGLVGYGIYYGTIYSKKSEANKMLELYSVAKQDKPGISVDEFTKNMEIRDLKALARSNRTSVHFGRRGRRGRGRRYERGRRGNSFGIPGFSINF